MRQTSAWALAVATALTASAAEPGTPPPYELVGLATPYAAFWDETGNLPTPELVTAFKARFETLLPGFFTARRDRFIETTSSLAGLLAPAHQSFIGAFPALKSIGPIYIVHSLGEFDGGR